MKIEPILVLLVGHDMRLLETRQWVLETRGYRAITLPCLSSLRTISSTQPIRVALLCHTLSPTQREVVTTIIRRRWPACRTLALTSESNRAPSGFLGQLLHTMDGPAQLLAMVNDVVREPTPPPTRHTGRPAA